MILYVDSEGVVDIRLRDRIKVGPVFSKTSTSLMFTADKNLSEIKARVGYVYQQKQIGKHNG